MAAPAAAAAATATATDAEIASLRDDEDAVGTTANDILFGERSVAAEMRRMAELPLIQRLSILHQGILRFVGFENRQNAIPGGGEAGITYSSMRNVQQLERMRKWIHIMSDSALQLAAMMIWRESIPEVVHEEYVFTARIAAIRPLLELLARCAAERGVTLDWQSVITCPESGFRNAMRLINAPIDHSRGLNWLNAFQRAKYNMARDAWNAVVEPRQYIRERAQAVRDFAPLPRDLANLAAGYVDASWAWRHGAPSEEQGEQERSVRARLAGRTSKW